MNDMKEKAMGAVKAFLERKGYEVVDEAWQGPEGIGGIDLVAVDEDGTLVFVDATVRIGTDGFPEAHRARGLREALATTWLAGNGDDYADTPVRFDEVAMMVVKENRALLLMLLVMVVLELLSSRGSLACPAAGGSRGGRRRHLLPLLDPMQASTDAHDTRSFLPSLCESISPDQMRSYALLRLALMYSCISTTVIHPSRPWMPSVAAHSAVRAMVPPIFPCGTAQVRRATPCPFSSARRLNRLMARRAHGGSGDGSSWSGIHETPMSRVP